MKKIIALSLVLVSLILLAVPANALIIDPEMSLYQTTTGQPYYLDDYDIYLEDFDDESFESSQDVVDFIYEVGTSRESANSNARSDVIDLMLFKLTVEELKLFIEYWEYIDETIAVTIFIETEMRVLYPNDYASDGSKINAFKHAFWTLVLANATNDASYALAFVTAHEEFDGNPEIHKYMDLYNDNVAYNYYVENNLASLSCTIFDLFPIAQQLVANGDLIYIVEDYEYVKKYVYNMYTGVTTTVTDVGDFHAYTNSDIPYSLPTPEYVVFPNDPNLPSIRPRGL